MATIAYETPDGTTEEAIDADAVVNIRLESSEIANGGSEVIAYGTAVRLD